MDYSVGSLSDLITGSITPNKRKVVQKAFMKPKRKSAETSFDNKNSVIKKMSNEVDGDQNSPENSHIKKKGKKRKMTKSENIESEPDVKRQPLKRNKVKNEVHTERIMEMGGKKTSIEDLDSDEESPPKKEKTEFQENAKRRIKKKVKEEKKVQNPEELARTIFVGNIPINIDKKKVKRYFRKYGIIEAIRIRGVPVADLNTSKKVAAIKKEFNPNRSNVFGYIRFENKEDALKAEAENGALFEGHHLRVHSCESTEKPDESKAIFVGNLSFDAVEDELWNLFEQCGSISYVRIIRDSYTGMGKGFAYVNFKDADAVQLALEMENVTLNDRELRISLCNLNVGRKNKEINKKNKKINKKNKKIEKDNTIVKLGKHKFKKSFNKDSDTQKDAAGGKQYGKTTDANAEFQGAKFSDKKKIAKLGKQKFKKNLNKDSDTQKNTAGGKQYGKTTEANAEFQGAKFSDKKKKRKINKGLLEKKKLVKKIAPKMVHSE